MGLTQEGRIQVWGLVWTASCSLLGLEHWPCALLTQPERGAFCTALRMAGVSAHGDLLMKMSGWRTQSYS